MELTLCIANPPGRCGLLISLRLQQPEPLCNIIPDNLLTSRKALEQTHQKKEERGRSKKNPLVQDPRF
ncbi:unnamed protein product [Allacma fusca]|uniref:Uncharacterized protein n=1 Tax=Allacma fusca TaxID=39272 RepID=A0A8J2J6V6_9HEXA|nr:unnamed protein product [Allacma fusca]